MTKTLVRITLFTFILVLGFYSCVQDESIQIDYVDLVEDTALSQFENEKVPIIKYSNGEVISGQYIVVFKKNELKTFSLEQEVTSSNYDSFRSLLKEEAQEIFKSNGLKEIQNVLQVYVKTLQGVAVKLSDQELELLRADQRIDYVEQDKVVKVSMGGPPGGGGGGGGATEVVPWGVSRVGGAIDGASSGIAWIIDSGIDLDHPDLNVNTGLSRTFLGGKSTPDDQNGHGTHVAGTVGAIDNEIGVIGVAAGAELVAVRVLDRRGKGSTSGVIAGVDYVGASASAGDAANMSLGGGISTSLDNAVKNASATCPFALAAGNESRHANNSSPARANGANIYTVSSMAQGDVWSSFSNYGNPPVDYCAPGSSVYSTYKGGGYSTLSGTSMASPHVCGILLIGGITKSGTVSGDPDGNADDIAHH